MTLTRRLTIFETITASRGCGLFFRHSVLQATTTTSNCVLMNMFIRNKTAVKNEYKNKMTSKNNNENKILQNKNNNKK